jgi:hypothetical protein
MTPPATWLLLLGTLVLTPLSAHAQKSRRACTDAACVDVKTQKVVQGGVRQTLVTVTNRGQEPLQGFTFHVDHACGNGTRDPRSYTLQGPLPPGQRQVLTAQVPVCGGDRGGPSGAVVVGIPGPMVVWGIPRPHHTVTVAPSGPGSGDCCSLPTCGAGTCDSKGGGDAGILIVVVGLVVGVAALATLVLAVGAVAGVALGWLTAKILQRIPLDWWQNALFMEGPLVLGVVAAGLTTVLGGLASYLLLDQQPLLAMGLGAGAVLASLAMVLLAGTAGTALVIGMTALFAQDKPEESKTSLDDVTGIETVETDEDEGAGEPSPG